MLYTLVCGIWIFFLTKTSDSHSLLRQILANSLEYPERIQRGLEWTQFLKRLYGIGRTWSWPIMLPRLVFIRISKICPACYSSLLHIILGLHQISKGMDGFWIQRGLNTISTCSIHFIISSAWSSGSHSIQSLIIILLLILYFPNILLKPLKTNV